MTLNNKKTHILCGLIILFCIIMALIDGVFKADYFIKSALKLVLFMGFPFLYSLSDKSLSVKSLFIWDKNTLKKIPFLCVGLYILILGAYLLLKDVFDFSNITSSLTSNIGVNGKNFIFVSLYISFINSLLEEFFFRGFAFLNLIKVKGRRFAYIFSALVFSIYHVAMMIGWFSSFVFALVLTGLFIGGLIFNYLNEKSGSIYPSWLVHMSANFAINTIGFMLFEII